MAGLGLYFSIKSPSLWVLCAERHGVCSTLSIRFTRNWYCTCMMWERPQH